MLTPFCDFHTHTTRSDGRLSPIELVRKAYAAGIRVLSITDHNYTEDLSPLRKAVADEFDEEMILVQGAEISALYNDGNEVEHELHIVALGFDPDNPNMKALLAAHQPDRKPYIDAILKKLRDDCAVLFNTIAGDEQAGHLAVIDASAGWYWLGFSSKRDILPVSIRVLMFI